MRRDSTTEVVPAVPERWTDLVQVFGERGDPSWCWCQYHCTTGGGFRESAAANREALHVQVQASPPPGLIAYRDGDPAGWVRLGPIDAFPRVLENRQRREAVGGDPAGLWAVTCFVVRPAHRRAGVATALLAGAIEFAREHGARTLEAHPVDTGGERAPSADLFRGVLSTFLAAGFSEVARTGPQRPLVRLAL